MRVQLVDVLNEGPAPALGGAKPRERSLRPGASFEDFYGQEAPGVLAVAYALSGSKWAAEEITQDAFLAAHRRWDEVSALEQPRAWVRRVAINMCASLTRRRLAEARAVTRLTSRDRPSVSELPQEDTEVWAAIRSLPRRQALVTVLFYIEDQSISQIAKQLGCAEGTVKAHLHRARGSLGKKLGVAGPEEDGK
ncbi:MAG TPA: sigma-70 family RNA polymerase sigma factor [Actinomycetota bacterium]|nr:sigma-70 family RNA polymerase sigma factor [Actinomycetota bacterium]